MLECQTQAEYLEFLLIIQEFQALLDCFLCQFISLNNSKLILISLKQKSF